MKAAAAHEAFLRRSAGAALPLLLWAAHFFFCYVAVAIGCDAGWDARSAFGMSALRAILLAVSAAALLAAGVLCVRRCRRSRGGERSLESQARLVVAALALLGIAWTTIPAAALPLCLLS